MAAVAAATGAGLLRILSTQLFQAHGFRNGSRRSVSTMFKAADLQIELTKHSKEKPDRDNLVFGKSFSDHMLTVEWSAKKGWDKPHIKPLQNLSLHPASSVLHYSIELFEGMKAFRGVDNKIRMFRPDLNMERMHRSALRACLPDFDKAELVECIRKLIEVDREWVPYSDAASLYIRPTFIGTEPSLGVSRADHALLFVIIGPVGPYFATGSFNPVSLLADPKFVRAWKGGVGDCKMGGNYGPTVYVQNEAQKQGCQQVLWLYGDEHEITEVGTMNIFVYWKNEQGEVELLTPPLDGTILPGVTRQSLLDLAQQWGEFKVSERGMAMSELIKGLQENRVKEVFGSGTACVICPVSRILYQGQNYHIPTMENGPELAKRFLKELTDIQYGRTSSNWTHLVI
ncbi:branched-chain-amino-acid aminotransferase, cytosolic-like isoform X1 [Carcharodon carcharias]|uniref:branched-chain-amino-acid aminotransferase, cytosolic-like isoform X1 n=1 Tax=Carcharodon carcharias TaxID=13397 RepID=UPI001B7EB712|nr:branched-chain-amino-acid aminotransferase, cytosolic-like isoform X1 [Carcharodon carcharias]